MSERASGLQLKSAAILLATFVAGGVFTEGVHAWNRPRHHGPEHGPGKGFSPGFPPRWAAELELTADQKTSVDAIFAKHRPDLQKVFDETWPKARAITDKMDAEIAEQLTPPQREKFKDLLAKRPQLGAGPPPPPGEPLPPPPGGEPLPPPPGEPPPPGPGPR